jgi:hypothetical protein
MFSSRIRVFDKLNRRKYFAFSGESKWKHRSNRSIFDVVFSVFALRSSNERNHIAPSSPIKLRYPVLIFLAEISIMEYKAAMIRAG